MVSPSQLRAHVPCNAMLDGLDRTEEVSPTVEIALGLVAPARHIPHVVR